MAQQSQQKESINEELDHSKDAFYANGFSVWMGGAEALIDFRQMLMRSDAVGGGTLNSVATKHNSVVMNPQMAKMLLNALKEQIANYEKNVGEIKLPENWKAAMPKPPKSAPAESYIR